MAPNNPSLEQVRQDILRGYGGHAPSAGDLEYIERHMRRYIRTLALLPGQTGALLDVGSYPGHLSLLAADRGWAVTGISRIDGTFIGSSFGIRMREKGIPIHNADVERDVFPFPDESFDAVYFNETVEHLPYNPFHALDQIWRVLKPGGALVFSVPNLASFDHRWALLKGRTIYPPLTEPLGLAFHSDVGQRHIREYTPWESRYLLSGQDKYLYAFAIRQFIMDRSWDGLFYTEHGTRVQWRNIRVGTVLRDLLTRVIPGLRSNIVIAAEKPSAYVRLRGPAVVAEGFYPPELSGAGDAFVRRPLEACWMTPRGRLALALPRAGRRLDRVELLLWLPAPASLAPLRVRAVMNGRRAAEWMMAPSPEPRRYSIPAPAGLPAGLERVTLDLETEGWQPAGHGLAGDARTLGVMAGLDPVAAVFRD